MGIQWTNTRDRYGAASIAMHWLMLLVLIAAYATRELEDALPWGEATLEAWHYAIGLSVLLLVAVRLALRLFGAHPRIAPEPAAWQRRSAAAVHLALYLFMIAMPVLGWMALAGEHDNARLPLLGWPIPTPALDALIVDAAEELHEAVATAGYWLVGLHAVGALFHHFVLRDNALLRMLPTRGGVRVVPPQP